jgi:hypothetical protein
MKARSLFVFLLVTSVFILFPLSAEEYHVSVKGDNSNNGSVNSPFKTISRAALAALPGDTITVHAGVYREWVNPARGGESDSERIVYRSAPGERAVIKGSEVITGWKKEKNGTWKVVIPNSFFGDYNPYQDSVFGDWFYRRGRIHHTGEVFLNGKSLYEKETLAKVVTPVADTKVKDREGSTYTWYCESDESNTVIWANFQEFNPNRELTEISTRRTCFYPDKPGVNYITISGFEISQAATQWGAPTAEQVGMVSTNWNKGWIIENNIIHDSKCSGITLGKERGTGHNVWSADKGNVNNDGNIHYIEVTFRTIRNGWNKATVGSHTVRNNTIYNCEQTGMCGSMGAAFSTIENNHIYNIWTKRQFEGAEIGGIKFHGAVDTYIRKNRIHDCGRGMWLDWMAQGTRISSNLMYNNDLEDIFFEVNHGPFIADNNILLSPVSISTMSEGGAYIHNLVAGLINMWPDLNRFTPYFLPHSTDIAGLTTVFGGDDRYFNNIFTASFIKAERNSKTGYGTEMCNTAKLPCRLSGNVYYNGAVHCEVETVFLESSSFNPGVSLKEDGESVYLTLNLDGGFSGHRVQIITSEVLGSARIPKARFENADGTPIILDRDYFGKIRSGDKTIAGPFAEAGEGMVTIKVW